MLGFLGLMAVATGVTFFAVKLNDGEKSDADVQTVTVERGPFTFTVTETGEIESAKNIEIRCEVKARNSSGTTILSVVPEGTFVEPGDFLVQLDSSALELELNAQKILVFNSQAAMIEAENIYDTAKIAKIEYLEGTYKQEQQTIQSEIFVAEETLRRAEEYFKYTQRLAGRGYVTQLQVDADRFAVEKARNELATAQSKLEVLRKFTKAKMLTQLDSDIQSAKAKLDSARSSYELDEAKLREIEEQVASCTITAPSVGQVKYANRKSYRGDNEVVIEAGAQVRENQVIIYLPETSKMQVLAEISEDSTKHVRAGMPALVSVKTVSRDKLAGRVVKVNDYPEPTSFFGSSVKQYETTIEILDENDTLRPGLTAKAEILVARLDDVLRVPLQTVVQHGREFYCIRRAGDAWELVEVKVGLNNDEKVIIKSGLQPGDQIVENPRLNRDLVKWPDASTIKSDADAFRSEDGSDRSSSSTEPGESKGKSPQSGPGRGGPLAQVDKNSDGEISADELAGVPQPFRAKLAAADSNGDGTIDRSELAVAMSRLGGAGR